MDGAAHNNSSEIPRITFVGNPVFCMEIGASARFESTADFSEAVGILTKALHLIHKLHLLLVLVPVCNSGRIVIHFGCIL